MSSPRQGTPGSPFPKPLQPIYRAPSVESKEYDIRAQLAAERADEENATALSPNQCPQMGCEHRMPNDPKSDPTLSRLLKKRLEVLVDSYGQSNAQLMVLNAEICARISYHAEVDVACEEGWPLSLDPELISTRVLRLQATLQGIVDTPSSAYMWQMLTCAYTPQLTLKIIASLFDSSPSHPRLAELTTSLRVG